MEDTEDPPALRICELRPRWLNRGLVSRTPGTSWKWKPPSGTSPAETSIPLCAALLPVLLHDVRRRFATSLRDESANGPAICLCHHSQLVRVPGKLRATVHPNTLRMVSNTVVNRLFINDSCFLSLSSSFLFLFFQ